VTIIISIFKSDGSLQFVFWRVKMRICCTKKLLDEIKCVTQGESEEVDFFCWSAHLITVNRRKTVVVVNDSNRFGFVLYGMKAKDFKRFSELVVEGIRECLRDEKIKDEIIEKYLRSAGDLVFGKTRGPKYVARLNKACELVDIFDDLLDPSEIIQHNSGRRLNYELIKIHKTTNYMNPYELLNLDLKQFAGEEIIRCDSIDLIIKLDLEEYTVWRRIITPDDINFQQLHEIIQIAFAWKDYHLYEFNVLDSTGESILNVISENEELYDLSEEGPIQLDSETKLKQYSRKNQIIQYCYDYGDNWVHEIVIQGIIADYNKNYPICVLGQGDAPPEDVGGIPGYKSFLEIVADPQNDDYETTQDWAKSQRYKSFDIDEVNRKLKNLLR